MNDPKNIAARERAQADAEEYEAAALDAEAVRLRDRAAEDRANADALDPPPAPAEPDPTVPVVAPPPPPSPFPQYVPFSALLGMRIGSEGDVFVAAAAGAVYYGDDDRWFEVQVVAGQRLPLTNQSFGGDPVPNVVKAGYVQDAAMVPTAPLPTTGPAHPRIDLATLAFVGAMGASFELSRPATAYLVAIIGDGSDIKGPDGRIISAGVRFTTKALAAGQYVGDVALFGSDPLVGLTKSVYVDDASALVEPPQAPPAEPAPAAPTPAAPTPAAPSPAAPMPAPAPVGPITLPALPLKPSGLQAFACVNYGWGPEHIPEATLAGLAAADLVDGPSGEMTTNEPDTGYRPEIGEHALAAQLMLATCDPRAETHLYDQADHSKAAWPYHDRVVWQTDAGPMRPWKYGHGPYGSMMYEGRVVDQEAHWIRDPLRSMGIRYDLAHCPNFLSLAAMVKGIRGDEAKFREYLIEQQYKVAFGMFQGAPPNYQQWEKGLMQSGQTRAVAWELRDRDDLFTLLEMMPAFGFAMSDDDKAWLAWCAQNMATAGDFLNKVYNPDAGTWITDIPLAGSEHDPTSGTFEPYGGFATNSRKNPFGILTWGNAEGYGSGDDGDTAILAPWQCGFMCAMVMRVAQRQHPTFTADQQATWKQLGLFAAKFPVLLFGDPDDRNALDIRFADRYTMKVGKYSTGRFFDLPTIRAMNDAWRGVPSNPTLMLAHDTPAAALTPMGLPGGFTNNVTIALARAVDLGASGAKEAWARFMTMQQYAQGGDLSFPDTPKGKTWIGSEAPIATPAPAPIPISTTVVPSWRCDKNSIVAVPATNTAQSLLGSNGGAASDITRTYGGMAAAKDFRGGVMRSSGHGTMQQVGFVAGFDEAFSALTWRAFGAPRRYHSENDTRMADPNAAGFMRNFYRGDDGTPDGAWSGHSYMGLQVQDVSEGGAPHLLQFGTSGGLMDFSALRIDMTKPGSDAYDLTPFPKDGLNYSGYGYPMVTAKLPGEGVIYSAQSGRQGQPDLFVPFDPSKYGGRTQIPVPVIAPDASSPAVFTHPTKPIVISFCGGWLARWGTPNSSPNETPKVQFVDFTKGIDAPVVHVVDVLNYECLSSADGQLFGLMSMGMAFMAAYGRAVGINLERGPFSIRPSDPDDWMEKPWIAEAESPSGGPFNAPQSSQSYSYWNRMLDVSTTPLDGVVLFADTSLPAQLWRPSFVTG